MDQSAVRSSILTRRRALDARARAESSVQAFERLRDSWRRENLPAGLTVGIYRSMPDEIDLDPVALWLESAGSRLYFPRITDSQKGTLEWACAPVSDSGKWSTNGFGILEPCEAISGSRTPGLDVAFVPGVAFGEDGQRIGMGKGFYDRMLSEMPGALRVSLAFDFQILPQLDENPWDQRVHWIFSERREVRACRVQDRIGQLIR